METMMTTETQRVDLFESENLQVVKDAHILERLPDDRLGEMVRLKSKKSGLSGSILYLELEDTFLILSTNGEMHIASHGGREAIKMKNKP
jgi:hypothetical protein